MERPRHNKRMARWAALNGADRSLVVSGIVGKALTLPGLMGAFLGAAAGPGAIVAGVAVAVGAFALWWRSARAIGASAGLSTAAMMWTIWRVPTWSFLGDILDFFSLF